MVAVANAALTESGAGETKFPAAFFISAYGNLVLVGVSEFGVTNRAGELFDLAGNAFAALAAKPDGPFHGNISCPPCSFQSGLTLLR